MPLNSNFDVRKELRLIQEQESNREKQNTALAYLRDIQHEFVLQAITLLGELECGSHIIADEKDLFNWDEVIESLSWEVAARETMIFLQQQAGIPWQFFVEELSRLTERFQNKVQISKPLATG